MSTFWKKTKENQDYFDDILQPIFNILSSLDAKRFNYLLLNEIIVFPMAQLMLNSPEIPEYIALSFVKLLRSCSKTSNKSTDYLNRSCDLLKSYSQNKTQVLSAYIWLELANELLYICRSPKDRQFDAFKDSARFLMCWICECQIPENLYKMICDKWISIMTEIDVICADFNGELMKHIEKIIKNNPTVVANVLDFIPFSIEKINENTSISYVTKVLDIIAEIVKIPCLNKNKVILVLPIIPKVSEAISKGGYLLDPKELEALGLKLYECLEYLLKPHQIYDVLKLFKTILPKISQHLNKKVPTKLRAIINDLTMHSNTEVSQNAVNLIADLDKQLAKPSINYATPKVSNRTAKIASMASNSKQNVSPLNLFAQTVQKSPVTVKGSMINNMNTPKSSRSLKIANAMPNFKKPNNLNDANSQDFVYIDSKVNVDYSKMVSHQKEVLKKRKDDIPALYQDLSQSQSQNGYDSRSNDSLSNDNKKETDEKLNKKDNDANVIILSNVILTPEIVQSDFDFQQKSINSELNNDNSFDDSGDNLSNLVIDEKSVDESQEISQKQCDVIKNDENENPDESLINGKYNGKRKKTRNSSLLTFKKRFKNVGKNKKQQLFDDVKTEESKFNEKTELDINREENLNDLNNFEGINDLNNEKNRLDCNINKNDDEEKNNLNKSKSIVSEKPKRKSIRIFDRNGKSNSNYNELNESNTTKSKQDQEIDKEISIEDKLMGKTKRKSLLSSIKQKNVKIIEEGDKSESNLNAFEESNRSQTEQSQEIDQEMIQVEAKLVEKPKRKSSLSNIKTRSLKVVNKNDNDLNESNLKQAQDQEIDEKIQNENKLTEKLERKSLLSHIKERNLKILENNDKSESNLNDFVELNPSQTEQSQETGEEMIQIEDKLMEKPKRKSSLSSMKTRSLRVLNKSDKAESNLNDFDELNQSQTEQSQETDQEMIQVEAKLIEKPKRKYSLSNIKTRSLKVVNKNHNDLNESNKQAQYQEIDEKIQNENKLTEKLERKSLLSNVKEKNTKILENNDKSESNLNDFDELNPSQTEQSQETGEEMIQIEDKLMEKPKRKSSLSSMKTRSLKVLNKSDKSESNLIDFNESIPNQIQQDQEMDEIIPSELKSVEKPKRKSLLSNIKSKTPKILEKNEKSESILNDFDESNPSQTEQHREVDKEMIQIEDKLMEKSKRKSSLSGIKTRSLLKSLNKNDNDFNESHSNQMQQDAEINEIVQNEDKSTEKPKRKSKNLKTTNKNEKVEPNFDNFYESDSNQNEKDQNNDKESTESVDISSSRIENIINKNENESENVNQDETICKIDINSQNDDFSQKIEEKQKFAPRHQGRKSRRTRNQQISQEESDENRKSDLINEENDKNIIETQDVTLNDSKNVINTENSLSESLVRENKVKEHVENNDIKKDKQTKFGNREMSRLRMNIVGADSFVGVTRKRMTNLRCSEGLKSLLGRNKKNKRKNETDSDKDDIKRRKMNDRNESNLEVNENIKSGDKNDIKDEVDGNNDMSQCLLTVNELNKNDEKNIDDDLKTNGIKSDSIEDIKGDDDDVIENSQPSNKAVFQLSKTKSNNVTLQTKNETDSDLFKNQQILLKDTTKSRSSTSNITDSIGELCESNISVDVDQLSQKNQKTSDTKRKSNKSSTKNIQNKVDDDTLPCDPNISLNIDHMLINESENVIENKPKRNFSTSKTINPNNTSCDSNKSVDQLSPQKNRITNENKQKSSTKSTFSSRKNTQNKVEDETLSCDPNVSLNIDHMLINDSQNKIDCKSTRESLKSTKPLTLKIIDSNDLSCDPSKSENIDQSQRSQKVNDIEQKLPTKSTLSFKKNIQNNVGDDTLPCDPNVSLNVDHMLINESQNKIENKSTRKSLKSTKPLILKTVGSNDFSCDSIKSENIDQLSIKLSPKTQNADDIIQKSPLKSTVSPSKIIENKNNDGSSSCSSNLSLSIDELSSKIQTINEIKSKLSTKSLRLSKIISLDDRHIDSKIPINIEQLPNNQNINEIEQKLPTISTPSRKLNNPNDISSDLNTSIDIAQLSPKKQHTKEIKPKSFSPLKLKVLKVLKTTNAKLNNLNDMLSTNLTNTLDDTISCDPNESISITIRDISPFQQSEVNNIIKSTSNPLGNISLDDFPTGLNKNDEQNLPGSPILENRNSELLNDTVDISPIRIEDEGLNNDGDNNDNKLNEDEIDTVPVNVDLTGTDDGKVENDAEIDFKFELPSDIIHFKSEIVKSFIKMPSSRSMKLMNLLPNQNVNNNTIAKSPQSTPSLSSSSTTSVSSQSVIVRKKIIGNVNGSPSSTERVRRMMLNCNNKSSGLDKVKIGEENNETFNVLEFRKDVPSPFATPNRSILKRKAYEALECGISPGPKRKRVNFSDPPITAEKIYYKEQNEDLPSENTNTLSELNQRKSNPIYAPLINCPIEIKEILTYISQDDNLYDNFVSLKLNTIGDLAKLTSTQVNQMEFLSNPKISKVVGALSAFADKYNSKEKLDEGQEESSMVPTEDASLPVNGDTENNALLVSPFERLKKLNVNISDLWQDLRNQCSRQELILISEDLRERLE